MFNLEGRAEKGKEEGREEVGKGRGGKGRLEGEGEGEGEGMEGRGRRRKEEEDGKWVDGGAGTEVKNKWIGEKL